MKVNKYPDGSSYVKPSDYNTNLQYTIKVNSYEDLWHLNQFVDVFNNLYQAEPIITIPNLIDAQADRRFNDDGITPLTKENYNDARVRTKVGTPAQKGVVELLWEIFGGTINEQGYKVLDSHIGCIYGDSITLDRAKAIMERLESKGFASTNVVLGVGSYTYQYNTRDTFGMAMKATYVEVKQLDKIRGNYGLISGREIFKDPVTDDGTKKSAKGLLCVEQNPDTGDYELHDQVNWSLIGSKYAEDKGCLQTIFRDGEFHNQTTLTKIRENLNKLINKN